MYFINSLTSYLFAMSEKRKRIVLTIKQKLEIIEKLERGESASITAGYYDIGVQTVRDIYRNKLKIQQFACCVEGPSKRKSMKPTMYPELDEILLKWFKQQKSDGIAVSRPMLVKQAHKFYTSLGLGRCFRGSSGWLSRFRQRYGICEFTGDSLSVNIPEVNDCSAQLQEHHSECEVQDIKVENIECNLEIDEKYSIVHQCALENVNSLLDYMTDTGFEYSDVVVVRKIQNTIKQKISELARQTESVNNFEYVSCALKEEMN